MQIYNAISDKSNKKLTLERYRSKKLERFAFRLVL